MSLTIGLGVVVALFGLLGLFRGVRRGVVALAGTLLAAVLVDLWREPLAGWLRDSVGPERPALPTFMLVVALFLLTALVVGYGGSVLLPRPDAQTRKPPAILDLSVGGLLGALNGALIVSYLLRYAEQIWQDETVTAMIATSPVAFVLDRWLPWFVMAMVLTTTIFVLMRLTAAVVRGRAAVNKPKPAAAPAVAATGTKTAASPASAGAAPPPPKSQAEADQRTLEKITQANSQKK